MAKINPIYTPDNCHVAYHLTLSLAAFWHDPNQDDTWLGDLRAATEKDGVRVLRHAFAGSTTSQFLLSTRPAIAPAAIVRSVKGRLQHIVRAARPRAFRRNYSIQTLGQAKRDVVEEYVSSQLGHHRMADPRTQAVLQRYQIHCPQVDLSQLRLGVNGQFTHNLHVVVVNAERWMETRAEVLEAIRTTLLGASRKKGHLLSRAGIFADHLHVAAGCGLEESPQEVALGYMNNLTYAQDMRPVFQFGYYVGAFGEYDLGATRRR